MLRSNCIYILFLCAICVISCTPSSEDTAPFEIVKSDINAYKALNEELAAYDYSFKSNIQIPQTRGKIWNKIRGFLLADAGGFLLGSTFGPIGGLWAAIFGSAVGGPVFAETLYSETNSGNAECPVAVTDSTTTGIVKPPYSATTNSLPSEVEKGNGSDAEAVSYWDIEVHCYNYATDSGYGYLHNRILSDIETENPGIYVQSNDNSAMVGSLISTVMKRYDYNVSPSDKVACEIKWNEILQECRSGMSENELVVCLKKFMPDYEYDISIINDFAANIEVLVDNPNELKNYLNGYLQIISNSALNQSQKDILSQSIEIAANSALLWSVVEKE